MSMTRFKELWDRSHGTPPPRRTSWERLLEGPGKEGQGPPHPRRTAGRTWEWGPRYPPSPEGPAGKDLGRRAWVPPISHVDHMHAFFDTRTSTGKRMVCLKKRTSCFDTSYLFFLESVVRVGYQGWILSTCTHCLLLQCNFASWVGGGGDNKAAH